MKRRLLIDWSVLDFVGKLKRRDRDFLFARFESIRQSPALYADYTDADDQGRTLDVNVAERFAVSFWDDLTDRHLKIMAVDWADDVL